MPNPDPSARAPELIARAFTHTERLALLAPEGRFTYGALLDASTAVATRLLDGRADLEGARVAYLIRPGFRWAAVQWGIWRAGGVTVPLALQQPEREIEYVIRDADAEQVIADASLAGVARGAAAGPGRPVLDIDEVLASYDAA